MRNMLISWLAKSVVMLAIYAAAYQLCFKEAVQQVISQTQAMVEKLERR